MTQLLDVNTLVALIWPSHEHHAKARAWLTDKPIALCPLAELGFIRVSTSPAFNADMEDARQALRDFIRDHSPGFIPADARALDGTPAPTSKATTDFYLANLAQAHGMKLATFDAGITHPARELIA